MKFKFGESLRTKNVLGKDNADDIVDTKDNHASILKLKQNLSKNNLK